MINEYDGWIRGWVQGWVDRYRQRGEWDRVDEWGIRDMWTGGGWTDRGVGR